MRKTHFAAGIMAAAILASCTRDIRETNELIDQRAETANETGLQIRESASGNHVPNEMIVKFKQGTTAEGRANALARIAANVKEHILTRAMKGVGDNEGIYLVHIPNAVEEATSRAKGLPEVLFAEPNWVYTHGAASTDPYFTNGSLWGMYGASTTPANQFGSNAAAAWAAGHTGSASVFVGIIDEGIQFSHPELEGQVRNPGENLTANGIDDDRNGYVDDIYGWDFANNDNSVYDGGNRGGLDDHGTHVAGTIGAKANSTGVVGVNWNVQMISGKFLGRNGGTTTAAIKAVDYFTDLKTNRGLNIVATNNSWGGGGFSQALYDAIVRANAAGILFIAAAGNGGSDGIGDDNDKIASYPSGYNVANVISVASITSSGAKSGFSNYGATTVDLGAPGSGINSTTAFNTYSSYSGTSMATPHVTGAVALYKSVKPGSTAAQVRSAILSSAVATASLNGRTVTGGRLDAFKALSY